MPDLDNGSNEFLERLSTRQLEALLRADFEEFELGGHSNDELVEKILEVIHRREQLENNSQRGDAEAAWERFASENAALLAQGEPSLGQAKKRPSSDGVDNSSEPRRVKHSLRRIMIAAAAISLCAVCTACAIQFKWFEMIRTYTEEIFHFRSVVTDNIPDINASDEPSPKFDSLEDALASYGVKVGLPKKNLDGYVSEGVQVLDLHEPVLSTSFRTPDKKSLYTITAIIHTSVNFDGTELNEVYEDYTSNGEVYSILTNHDQVAAIWKKENVELTIRGTITLEEIKAMIDSI